ncbi:MAG: hypothetical protein O3C63_00810 [Cyanobacteria bacterium]|nr:hypothetical protein [Cyanobacteriota bacterium]MDA1020227.1 hypothetical protein [Cyanobacteriota bacterium]
MATCVVYFAMVQFNYPHNIDFQTQAIPSLELTQPNKTNQASLSHNQSKTLFWFILAILLLLPFSKSFFVNFFDLSQNIKKNIELRVKRKELIQDNQNLNNKIKEFHSFLGMKRTIKEEIKVIEENEILLKITP